MYQCMDRKTSRGFGYSTKGSRLNGKTSSLQDDNGLSIDHLNPLSALVNRSLPQKKAIAKTIHGKIKTDVSKCTLKQVGTSYVQSSPRISQSTEISSGLKAVNSKTLQNLLEDRTGVLESSSAISSRSRRKQIKQRPGSGNFYAPTISSTLRLIASRDTKKAIKSSSQSSGAGANKYNLKNNSCSSISEVIPSGCSQSISVQSRKSNLASRIFLNGESSASRTRSTSASSTGKFSDAHSYNNTGGLVESPMILERTEQNQELTYEHELNLSLGRLHCDDQHREMRMDIDNMAYEELVELVEKIGSVSTGLTDEALTNCLKRSNFKLVCSSFGITECVEDGNRCSICQEECADGEDIGALACEHWYHVVCIQQWLKRKNWCPICKSPAWANS